MQILITSYPGIGEKVGFYFSVQSGGSFDIDYMVQDPNEKVILEGQGERQGDFIFTANTVSYRCFQRTILPTHSLHVHLPFADRRILFLFRE